MNQTEKLGMNRDEDSTKEVISKETYFFDTYALFEIVRGNPKYKKYTECNIITTIFNLAEFNYNLKKERSKKETDTLTEKYYPFIVEVNLKDLKNAMDLKIKDKDPSIPDVIGYIVAKRHNVKFLTGDKGFEKMENVEFVVK